MMTKSLWLAWGLWCGLVTWRAAADWPQWRGPDRTDVSSETGLLSSWPAGGPKRVWLYDKAGHGYSGPAVVDGRLYTLGTRDDKEVVLALDAAQGRELWVAPVGGILNNGWGSGPRSTPTVAGEHVFALGGQGDLVCFLRDNGKVVWRSSMKQLGGKVPNWGYTESVLVDGDLVVCTPGGAKGTVAALDRKTGALRWQSAGLTDNAHYASIIVANHGGVRHYVQLTERTVFGVSPKDGALLWKSPWPGSTAVIPTPIFHEGHVYVTSSYGAGCKLVKLSESLQPTEVYENKVMKNHHGGVVRLGEHLYGYSDGPGWICQNFLTGAEVWSAKKLGKGALTSAEGMLYCVDEDSGTVALVRASPEGWSEKGRFKLDPQSTIRASRGKIWTHPVISGGRLFLRDQDHIYCYDIRKS